MQFYNPMMEVQMICGEMSACVSRMKGEGNSEKKIPWCQQMPKQKKIILGQRITQLQDSSQNVFFKDNSVWKWTSENHHPLFPSHHQPHFHHNSVHNDNNNRNNNDQKQFMKTLHYPFKKIKKKTKTAANFSLHSLGKQTNDSKKKKKSSSSSSSSSSSFHSIKSSFGRSGPNFSSEKTRTSFRNRMNSAISNAKRTRQNLQLLRKQNCSFPPHSNSSFSTSILFSNEKPNQKTTNNTAIRRDLLLETKKQNHQRSIENETFFRLRDQSRRNRDQLHCQMMCHLLGIPSPFLRNTLSSQQQKSPITNPTPSFTHSQLWNQKEKPGQQSPFESCHDSSTRIHEKKHQKMGRSLFGKIKYHIGGSNQTEKGSTPNKRWETFNCERFLPDLEEKEEKGENEGKQKDGENNIFSQIPLWQFDDSKTTLRQLFTFICQHLVLPHLAKKFQQRETLGEYKTRIGDPSAGIPTILAPSERMYEASLEKWLEVLGPVIQTRHQPKIKTTCLSQSKHHDRKKRGGRDDNDSMILSTLSSPSDPSSHIGKSPDSLYHPVDDLEEGGNRSGRKGNRFHNPDLIIDLDQNACLSQTTTESSNMTMFFPNHENPHLSFLHQPHDATRAMTECVIVEFTAHISKSGPGGIDAHLSRIKERYSRIEAKTNRISLWLIHFDFFDRMQEHQSISDPSVNIIKCFHSTKLDDPDQPPIFIYD